ncbi:phosphatidylinositol N-acetylglucosaminyltransferase-domain-containing protein [Podospora conica]|nr:phosphatidylinositol N-acetylglucosaminyltransferase-domain-containing protein [Schizothecium conicum]
MTRSWPNSWAIGNGPAGYQWRASSPWPAERPVPTIPPLTASAAAMRAFSTLNSQRLDIRDTRRGSLGGFGFLDSTVWQQLTESHGSTGAATAPTEHSGIQAALLRSGCFRHAFAQRPASGSRWREVQGTSRRRSRRRKRFQKLLWGKQSYPDNYTNQATFLANLQQNPRLQPCDFWPLVADSTTIVQHVCSVIIFIVCFLGISQERVSPVSVWPGNRD